MNESASSGAVGCPWIAMAALSGAPESASSSEIVPPKQRPRHAAFLRSRKGKALSASSAARARLRPTARFSPRNWPASWPASYGSAATVAPPYMSTAKPA